MARPTMKRAALEFMELIPETTHTTRMAGSITNYSLAYRPTARAVKRSNV